MRSELTMQSKKPLHPRGKDTSLFPYSPGIQVGEMVFVSGQGPVDFSTLQFQLGSIEAETELTLQNVSRVLAEADCTLADVVKATVHLADLADFAAFNAVYERMMPRPFPARTTVQSVLGQSIKVEIDVIAIQGCGLKKD